MKYTPTSTPTTMFTIVLLLLHGSTAYAQTCSSTNGQIPFKGATPNDSCKCGEGTYEKTCTTNQRCQVSTTSKSVSKCNCCNLGGIIIVNGNCKCRNGVSCSHSHYGNDGVCAYIDGDYGPNGCSGKGNESIFFLLLNPHLH